MRLRISWAGRAALVCLLAFVLVPVTAFVGMGVRQAQADDVLSAVAPQFTRHPSDSTYAKGANARFYVRAASTDGGYLTYQWYRSQPYTEPLAATGSALSEEQKQAIKNEDSNPTALSDAEGAATSVLTTVTPDVTGVTYYYYWVEVTNHKDMNGDEDADDPGETVARDSAFALTKVVDRTLFTSVQHGDFEYVSSYSADYSAEVWKPSNGYWDTTHLYTNKPKILEIGTRSQYAVGSTMMAELSSYNASSIYQEIATVPGKIYEWSLDHYGRASTGRQVMAVIIGPVINEESDYKDFGIETDRWSVDTTKATTSVSYLYPYGANWDTYFADIFRKLAEDNNTTLSALQSLASGAYTYTVQYGSNTYYVQISSVYQGERGQRSGVYTVPVGQGTTVFGFVPVTSTTGIGNILDNIKFASATGLSAEQESSYMGDTSLSTDTKAGYAYALAEVRGSSVNELVGLSAYYAPSSSAAAVAVAPDDTLGAGGWYVAAADGTPFATGGTITFRELVPGKTYRIIGIPALAVNTGLHTNESPGNVLDTAYYTDVKIKAAYGGATHVLPSYDVEVYDGDKARITLKNTNASVQYALLAGDGAAPVTTGPALPSTAWKGSASGTVVFDALALDTNYWLVSRPADYTEVDYAVASYVEDGTLAALRIVTPVVDAVDLAAADIARAAGGTGISIRAEGTREGYNYALADPANGEIVSGPFDYTGDAVSFTDLDPAAVYQVVSRVGTGTWLKGVRVYPYPPAFVVDYDAEAVRSSAAPAGAAGFIPADTEYRVRASGGAAPWLVGGADAWRRGTGTERLELDQAGVTAGGKSVFDALDDAGAGGAVISYRLAIADGYVGQSVQPVLSLTAPARLAAPSAAAGDCAVNFTDELLTVGAAALQWRAEASSGYTALDAGGSADFAALGWSAAVGQRVVLRHAPDAASFASRDSAPVVLPGRPPAPEGLTAALV
ncbi:MAG: hypothetical protein LBC26_08195, partial [Oscillospiraceae bacterium]|nr:hypothetical protein [Oscillospiraceae bacterium]